MNLNLGAEDRTGVQDKAKTAHRQWRWHSRVHALSNCKEACSTVLGSSGWGASNASMNSKAFLTKAGANTQMKSQHSVPCHSERIALQCNQACRAVYSFREPCRLRTNVNIIRLD